MAKKSMKAIASMMSSLDICMLTTMTGRNSHASRPMSNNGDVEYDGNSYFFAFAKTRLVRDIRKNPNVNLAFIGTKRLRKLYVSVTGRAKLITDRAQMEDHWNKDLEIYFSKGLDTPGITMIAVKASHIKYWHGSDEGELRS